MRRLAVVLWCLSKIQAQISLRFGASSSSTPACFWCFRQIKSATWEVNFSRFQNRYGMCRWELESPSQ